MSPAVAPEQKKLTLKGSLSGFQLAEIIQMLECNQKSGELSYSDQKTSITIVFEKGQVVSASSNDPNLRLGSLLQMKGKLSAEKYQEAGKRVNKDRNLTKVLVEDKFITAKELWDAVLMQIREIFLSLLAHQEGTFVFYSYPEDRERSSQQTIHMNTQNLLLDGLRQMDEMSLYLQEIPSRNTVYAKKELDETVKLIPEEKIVYDLIDGERTLEEIMEESKLSRYQVLKSTYHLIKAGVIRPLEIKELRIKDVPPASEVEEKAAPKKKLSKEEFVINIFNEMFMEIYAGLLEAKGSTAILEDLNSFFDDVPQRFRELFADIKLTDQGMLPVETLVANLQQLGIKNPLDFLNEALNELYFFELFRVRENITDSVNEDILMERVQSIKMKLYA